MKFIMNTETALNKCDFGETIGDECHKLSHTRIQGLGNLSDYSEDEQETLLMRAGIACHGDKTNMTKRLVVFLKEGLRNVAIFLTAI